MVACYKNFNLLQFKTVPLQRNTSMSGYSPILEALRQTRKAKGISQKVLAAKVGVNAAHISRIETGRLNPTLATLTEIARALEMEIMLVPRKFIPAVKGLTRTSQPGARLVTGNELQRRSAAHAEGLFSDIAPPFGEDENG